MSWLEDNIRAAQNSAREAEARETERLRDVEKHKQAERVKINKLYDEAMLLLVRHKIRSIPIYRERSHRKPGVYGYGWIFMECSCNFETGSLGKILLEDERLIEAHTTSCGYTHVSMHKYTPLIKHGSNPEIECERTKEGLMIFLARILPPL